MRDKKRAPAEGGLPAPQVFPCCFSVEPPLQRKVHRERLAACRSRRSCLQFARTEIGETTIDSVGHVAVHALVIDALPQLLSNGEDVLPQVLVCIHKMPDAHIE